MKRALSLILSFLVVFSVLTPALATSVSAKAADAYATVFTASDFQSTSCYNNLTAMMQAAVADGITAEPDAFIFGGDYTADSDDPAVQVPKVTQTVQGVYSGYSEDNLIYVQGNHDSASSALTPTGFYEFDNFVVYSINEDDFKTGQATRTGYDATVQALAANVAAELENLAKTGDTRPVFVATHVPLHHSSRSSYGENLYSKYLFDVLNEYGKKLDIIFLFGHNHSSAYDDYIGGAVNYIAKDEDIRIPIPDTTQQGETGYTTETLNFTYMNYGYVGYSNNADSTTSTSTLTMGAFELCPATIEISRYSTTGVYTTETIERVNPVSTDPYVNVTGNDEGTMGDSDVLYGTVANIEGATYSWSTTDDSVVKVLPAGKNAQVIYVGEGEADVTLTVTAADGKTYSDTVTIKVNPCSTTETIVTPGEEYTVYELTDTITAGQNYIIASAGTDGTTYAMTSTVSGKKISSATVDVIAADDTVSNPYIKNPDSAVAIWTSSVPATGYFAFADNTNAKYLAMKKATEPELVEKVTNKAQWTYANNYLTNRGQSTARLTLSGEAYVGSTTGTPLYFYQERIVKIPGSTETVVTPNEYNPVVNFKNGTKNVDGLKLKYYEAEYGDTIMIDGSFSGFTTNADKVTATWSSSDTSVATVENGLVTFVSSGEATINYVVTDGETTITKSVTVLISRGEKPLEMYQLTDTFEAGKSYIIASTNQVGDGYMMGTPTFTLSDTTIYYLVRMTAYKSEIMDVGGVPTITTEDDGVIWNAVADADGNIYLVNELYGTYLYANHDSSWTHENLSVTDDKSIDGTVWHMNSDGFIVSDSGDIGPHLSGDINFRANTEPTAQFLYEKVETKPFVTLQENNTSVKGVTQTVYSVNSETTRTLKGTHKNFGETVTEQWISSDENIATVDSNGVVTFKGVEGKVDITYLVTDTDGNSASATTSFDAKLTSEPVRVFKYTETIEAGKKYVVVSSNDVGAAYVMTNGHKSDKYLTEEYVVIQPDTTDGNVYVEIPADENQAIWVAETSDTEDNFFLKSENDNTYLFATSLETTTKVYTSEKQNTELYKWNYLSKGLYNCEVNPDTNTNTGIRRSSNGYFRVTETAESEGSSVYLFEEIVLVPYVHIRSRYTNVENTTLSRSNVAPYQTEELGTLPEHFPNDGFVAYEWTSSNPDVATVDENGVVTYTGNPGETEITVKATSLIPDADNKYATVTSKVNINVLEDAPLSSDSFVLTDTFVPGERYVFSASNVSGSSVIMSNAAVNAESENKLDGVACTIEETTQGMVIKTENEAAIWECIESGTNGYYHFKNVETGEYLALVADNDLTPYRQVTTSSSLTEFDPEAYLITAGNNKVYSQQSTNYKNTAGDADSNKLSVKNDDFRLTTSTGYVYIYQEVAEEDLKPDVQIRISSFAGTDDITNALQNIYNIREGDTLQLLRYTDNFADITSTQWSVTDESIATVDEKGLLTFTGKNGYVTVKLTVTGTDFDGEAVTQTVQTTIYVSTEDYESPTEDYPQYPHEGSVRVNKTASNTIGQQNFQTTGVTEVELSVTGVPLPQAVDVVIVFDHSSSMNDYGRLQSAIEDTRDFALQIVNKNRSNRVAIVTFDRYRNNYRYWDSAEPTYSTATSSTEDRIITGDGTAKGAFVTYDESEKLVSQVDSLAYNSTAGTNYDFGLQTCYEILEAAKSDPNANKHQYVVFMSDGEPYVFNRLYVDYGTADADGAYEAWLRGDETNEALAAYMADSATYPVTQYFNTDGENWFAQAIKTAEGDPAGMPTGGDGYYDNYNVGLGATMFTIGYGAGEAGSLTADILTTMASVDDNFYYAEADLQKAYDSILEKIVHAANNAVVTDKMGENFDLQFAPSFTLNNGMATITLDPAPHIEVGTWSLNSDDTRKSYTAIETIKFETNANGDLIAAYSNVLGGENIYDVASSKIVGRYVTYDILTETFTWNIGDITRDEITLKYYAYLEGSAEGEREAGVYDTNEYAKVDYVNYLGNECHQTFPVPSMGWKQAAVNYEFYLVNAKGEPVNSEGIVVPFSERVLIGQEQTKQLLLNSTGEYSAYTLVAQQELPEGYVLFNEDTSYQVAVSSGDNPSMAKINDSGKSTYTTYFRDGTVLLSGDGVVEGVTDYTNTHVSFAVLYLPGIIPDSVVVDYGLPVKISVLANDLNAFKGSINAIGTALADGTQLNNVAYSESRLSDGVKSDLVLANGTASIADNKIVYTPTNLTMSSENVFYYEYLTEDGEYYYTTVTVIPASNIYYEDTFFTFTDGNGYVWEDVGEAFEEKYQAEDRPGTFSFADIDANNVYGRDDAYADSFTYSLGSAKRATVDNKASGKEPYAEFTFCGTGFDLFSVTNNDSGVLIVEIYDLSTNKLLNRHMVNNYYGYSYNEETGEFEVNKESKDSLYQIPVISKDDMAYGTYRVKVYPKYFKAMDKGYDSTAEVNAYDVYIDSVRIYNPAGDPAEDSVIGDAYLADGEYAPKYLELRKSIISADTFYADVFESDTDYDGAIFIDGIASLDENGISDKYLNAGPNNEVYLAKGQAIAFNITTESKPYLSSLQLGMKVVKGDTADVVIMNASNFHINKIQVSGAHEMYRKLNTAIIWDQDEIDNNNVYKTKYAIIIVNTSDSVLSLTNLKWAYEDAPESTAEEMTVSINSDTPAQAFAATKRLLAENENSGEEDLESSPINGENATIEWSDTSFVEGKEATLKVTTAPDVVKVTVDGIDVTECEIDENGNKLWTYTFTVTQVGENNYEVQLFDKNGNAGEPVKTENITVEEAPEDEPTTNPGEDTTDTPDDGTTDAPGEGDEPQAEKTIVQIIFEFFLNILRLFRRVLG